MDASFFCCCHRSRIIKIINTKDIVYYLNCACIDFVMKRNHMCPCAYVFVVVAVSLISLLIVDILGSVELVKIIYCVVVLSSSSIFSLQYRIKYHRSSKPVFYFLLIHQTNSTFNHSNWWTFIFKLRRLKRTKSSANFYLIKIICLFRFLSNGLTLNMANKNSRKGNKTYLLV